MKYRELKEQLSALTEEQLEQEARTAGELKTEKIESVWVLEEDYIDPFGEGAEPVSHFEPDDDFTADDIATTPRAASKGDVFLSLEE
ncbi:MAG TPA: hypothetical protein P5142_00240 [Spirochaetia bacterium]|nr:hypothetical protein [Spirochaetia bacterium]